MSTIVGWAVIGLFLYATLTVFSVGKGFFVPVLLAFLLAMVFGPTGTLNVLARAALIMFRTQRPDKRRVVHQR